MGLLLQWALMPDIQVTRYPHVQEARVKSRAAQSLPSTAMSAGQFVKRSRAQYDQDKGNTHASAMGTIASAWYASTRNDRELTRE